MSRLLFYRQFACDPHYNMAVDEWLFDRAHSAPGSLFIRLYSWARGAITFGVNQDMERAFDSSQLNGTPVIRRITGGRALYHDCSELTYSIAVNLSGWRGREWATDRSSFYRAVAEALAEFVTVMGKDAGYCRRSAESNSRSDFFHKAACFASVSRYEVLAESGKIVASAARQMGDTIVQHGSIKLDGVAYHPALYYPVVDGLSHSVGLQPLSGPRWELASDIFPNVLSRHLGIDLRRGEFDLRESAELDSRAKLVCGTALRQRILLNS